MSGQQVAPPATAPVQTVSFNLWTEPWIPVLTCDGQARQLSIRDCLANAHELYAFADPSPLVVASLQRLLAAIVQDICRPRSLSALAAILMQGRFDPSDIDAFGNRYAHRFDLFSPTEPFLQTADIGLELPKKKGDTKTVGYLFPEEPTATNINHFFHRYDDDYQFSPATAALGLITIPAFATSGGAGIKPSINGVPPLYVLPVGDTLFETLAFSIITPDFQPQIASADDRPAWNRDPVIERSKEVLSVGYLESLTFPARRVRLFPEQGPGRCSRSGEWSDILVRRMVFDMGHSRPKGSALWMDPFAAYRFRGKEEPAPIRPQEGKVLWREYGNLFHTVVPDDSGEVQAGVVQPPAVVLQVAQLQDHGIDHPIWRFRCTGIRTDMKAKVFEWVDEALEVPAGLLSDPLGQFDVEEAVQRAEDWSKRIRAIHYGAFGDDDQFGPIRQRMEMRYWTRLADPFREFVLAAADSTRRADARRDWVTQLFKVGEQVLDEACEETGERGERLQRRAQALTSYRMACGAKRKEWLA